MKKATIIAVSISVFAAAFTCSYAQKSIPIKKTLPNPNKQAQVTQNSTTVKPVTMQALRKFAVPQPLRGVYSTAWIAGSQKIDDIISFMKKANLNSLVIDVKDDTGIISFPSEIPLAKEIGARSYRISKLKELVARLRKENIYTIARIVVFKDPLLAQKHTELAVLDKNGGLWRDFKGMIWVDPNNPKVWKYNLDVAKEAVELGFNEIQFDYVRFVSDGKINRCVYPSSKGAPKEDVIRDFLLYAKKDLNAMGVPVSADIFGLVLSVPDDNNIGQKLEKIMTAVDFISPMVYPSHYPKGYFNINEPNLHPYEVVNNSMKDVLRRMPNSQAKIRPWLQDFNLGVHYGRPELNAQIKALSDNGVHDWIFWNPSNRYDASKYGVQ